MMDLLAATGEVLTDAGFAVSQVLVEERSVLAFESPTVLGFVFGYPKSEELVRRWENDVDLAVSNHQFGLRRAGEKAWNTYVVLLAADAANYITSITISAIEEDLTGTRKIARAGIRELADVRSALLPLLPVQAAPQLDAVDMMVEIRQRTTELPDRSVRAFLSNAESAVVVQILEDT